MTKCIGHRGAMGHAPENTKTSILKAIELGAHGIEIDIWCIDDELVVIHDETLERTTNGSGLLHDMSFSALRTLDAGDGNPIPTLREVIGWLPDTFLLNIELKGPNTGTRVSDYLAKLDTSDELDILLSSFQKRELLHASQRGLVGGLLRQEMKEEDWTFVIENQMRSVHVCAPFVEPVLLEKARQNDLEVHVWTVNHLDTMKTLLSYEVDGIITDYPDRYFQALI